MNPFLAIALAVQLFFSCVKFAEKPEWSVEAAISIVNGVTALSLFIYALGKALRG